MALNKMNFRYHLKKHFAWIIYLFLSLFVILFMNTQITDEPITGDATQNLRLGYYFYTEGVLAVLENENGSPMPSNYREPVPTVVNGLFMHLHPKIRKSDSIETFKNGKNTIPIKQVNLLWLLFLQIGVGLLIYAATKNHLWPFIGWFLVLFYFIRFGDHFDHLYTEIQGATMIVWTTYFLYLAVVEKKRSGFLIGGIFFGLTILTKAVFFYLTPLIILFLYLLNREPGMSRKFGLMAAAVLIVVMPWLIRNQILLNDFSITHRGGKVLYNRAIMNDLEPDVKKAALYLWGPMLYKDVVSGTFLDVDDSSFAAGGKFEKLMRYPESDLLIYDRLDPGLMVSFHSKMRVLEDSLSSEMLEMGLNREETRVRSIAVIEQIGKDIILQNPLNHIASIPLFFWRGMWVFPNSTIPVIDGKLQIYINNLMNLAAFLTIFILLIIGLVRRHNKLIVISVIPAVLILFHAAVTHNIPRFNEVLIPSMLVCLSVFLYLLYKIWLERKGSNPVDE